MARSKSHRRRRLIIIAAALMAAIVAISAVWVVHLDRVVTREFRGRLWSIPARVYAEPIDNPYMKLVQAVLTSNAAA